MGLFRRRRPSEPALPGDWQPARGSAAARLAPVERVTFGSSWSVIHEATGTAADLPDTVAGAAALSLATERDRPADGSPEDRAAAAGHMVALLWQSRLVLAEGRHGEATALYARAQQLVGQADAPLAWLAPLRLVETMLEREGAGSPDSPPEQAQDGSESESEFEDEFELEDESEFAPGIDRRFDLPDRGAGYPEGFRPATLGTRPFLRAWRDAADAPEAAPQHPGPVDTVEAAQHLVLRLREGQEGDPSARARLLGVALARHAELTLAAGRPEAALSIAQQAVAQLRRNADRPELVQAGLLVALTALADAARLDVDRPLHGQTVQQIDELRLLLQDRDASYREDLASDALTPPPAPAEDLTRAGRHLADGLVALDDDEPARAVALLESAAAGYAAHCSDRPDPAVPGDLHTWLQRLRVSTAQQVALHRSGRSEEAVRIAGVGLVAGQALLDLLPTGVDEKEAVAIEFGRFRTDLAENLVRGGALLQALELLEDTVNHCRAFGGRRGTLTVQARAAHNRANIILNHTVATGSQGDPQTLSMLRAVATDADDVVSLRRALHDLDRDQSTFELASTLLLRVRVRTFLGDLDPAVEDLAEAGELLSVLGGFADPLRDNARLLAEQIDRNAPELSARRRIAPGEPGPATGG